MTKRAAPDTPRDRRFSAGLTQFLAAVAAAILGGVLLAAHGEIAQAQTTKSITNDDSTYYRLKVKLAYKGEPQDFDIVVGCNVHQITYKEGGRTYEVGLLPTVFGRRMSDGKGLVIRPPNACRGETTANGKLEPDLLPVVVVYDHADTLDFGIAYLSEDAYESPLSVLKFGGATIETATRAEFDKFRREQTNLVTHDTYWTGAAATETLRRMGIKPALKPFAGACEAYERFRVPDEVKPLVRRSWPDGRPNYWQPSHDQLGAILDVLFKGKLLLQSDGPNDSPHPPRSFGPVPEFESDLGLPTRAGGGVLNPTRAPRPLRFPAAYYPAAGDYRSDQWPADRQEWPSYIARRDVFAETNVDFRGGLTRGFAYCSAMREGMMVGIPSPLDSEKSPRPKRVVGRVDGEDVDSKPIPMTRPVWFFERDEYVFRHIKFGLGSPRGDV